ncbi:MAG: tetratricopeptide repeat protein [Bacteroidia bacterium]|nr:tetratricopeptide repeat protein [Bacteroidia bacterium]MBT8279160.1 tetratricopeptide repeat protein [Bacteroidia bacterium]NND25537.1 tetratricopeptide repeat protein [Flavobacteriaceae bacterium]NNK60848.1 tetratricopeptide repeat protein [Flavobacteriaceae bacterium]NNL33861.1 tetratricopeptide repeat protein [Flavobacteriaceae bacterium]
MLRYTLLFISVFLSSFAFSQDSERQTELDSIQSLRKLSQQETYEFSERLKFAKLASELSNDLQIDSTILLSNNNLSSLYLKSEDYKNFRKINHSNLSLSTRLNDSLLIAKALRNLAWYHYLESASDSSYYYYFNARKIYGMLGRVQDEAEVLLNMADIQETERDYIGSENNAVQAINLIQTLPETPSNMESLWILYNLMGINSENLKNYDQALEFHQLALSICDKTVESSINRLFTMNNIAIVFRELGEYDTALEYHYDLLNEKSFKENAPSAYAFYLNNLAYTQFLSGKFEDEEILKKFWWSRYICNKEEYEFGLMTIDHHLSEFYAARENRDSALYYNKETYRMAKRLDNNEMLLESLFDLANLEEGEVGKAYLKNYINLSDSLLQNERGLRNKFAKIEFQTDQIKAENLQISRERLIFLLVSIGLLVTLFLLYIIISQRSRNKQLEFNQLQQQANEEIYNLMLAQQDKIDEGRTKEKKRISEELHDGILGRLFGTRLSLDSLNFQQSDEAIKTRGQYIDELKSIEQEIRKISHDLNSDFISGSSFTDIIKTLIENQTKAFQLTYDFDQDEDIDWDQFLNRTKIHIYRMLQETMQNIYKHANANHIKISFELKNNVILLTVEDNGSGFKTNKARKGIGLKNFESRANEIGGKVEIFSKLGHGTRVKIHIPTA